MPFVIQFTIHSTLSYILYNMHYVDSFKEQDVDCQEIGQINESVPIFKITQNPTTFYTFVYKSEIL